MNFPVKVVYSIKRPVSEVFDAIVNKDKITGYFVSKVSGNIEEGSKLKWEWEDVGASCDVLVLELKLNSRIVFEWGVSGNVARVEIQLEEINAGESKIQITEGSFGLNSEDVAKALQQIQGWTDFVCSLKAFLYTGINLRNGQGS